MLSDINFLFGGTLPFFTLWNDRENFRHKNLGSQWMDWFQVCFIALCRWVISCNDAQYQLQERVGVYLEHNNACNFMLDYLEIIHRFMETEIESLGLMLLFFSVATIVIIYMYFHTKIETDQLRAAYNVFP